MKVRALLTFTAIVSAILGAVVVYLVLSVPNDLKADSMLKSARKDLESGKRDAARTQLSRVVQQYPRTDAAAAATIALVALGEQERKELDGEIQRLRDENAKNAQSLAALQQSVDEVKNAPPKVVVQAAPKRAAKKKARPAHHRRRRR